MTRGEVIMMPFLDLLIHSWDLAKGTGQSTTLDGGLLEVCYNALGPQMDGFRGMQCSDSRHFLGPAVQVSDNASLQDKLIGLSGRQP